MGFLQIIFRVSRNRIYLKQILRPYTQISFKPQQNFTGNRKLLSTSALRSIKLVDGDETDNEFDQDLEFFDNYPIENESEYARDLLYRQFHDNLFRRIYNCVSVQELFNVFNNNKDSYKCGHLVESVLVLYDLKSIYEKIKKIDTTNKKLNEFTIKLKENENFQKLLEFIRNETNNFDREELSYLVYYLNKLHLTVDLPIMQLLLEKLRDRLLEEFSITPAKRYLSTVFDDHNLKSYLMSQSLIPLVFEQIDKPQSLELFADLTLSLNRLNRLITDEILEKYLKRVESLLENQEICGKDYKLILKIISLLNYPKWRHKSTSLMSDCILLMKNHLNLLNAEELAVLYDIFFKIQEPGSILNELQRSSSRYLQQMDDVTNEKIKLFSSLIYFSSPNLRMQYKQIINDYIKNTAGLNNLIELRKILTYTKVSDYKLCYNYWDKVLEAVKTDDDVELLKICQNYLNFHSDVENFRHLKFENEILKLLNNQINEYQFCVFPRKICGVLCFALLYSDDHKFLNDLVENLERNWTQLKYIDCLKLLLNRIQTILNNLIEKEMNYDLDLWKNGILLRSCIYKESYNLRILNQLLLNYRNCQQLSSKIIENIIYSLTTTITLIPEVLDGMVDYIIEANEKMLAFNTERLLYLCYILGYQPNKHEFFQITTNLTIRDQERMSGLSAIQSALALCFFNKLPKSLIQSIFNTEFMDKLDNELANCYSKDKYPQRVRNCLMQLNRAVCLDYPHENVPWFHQKYVDELNKYERNPRVYAKRIKEYLAKILGNRDAILEDFIAPYGYHVDFVVNFDSNNEPTVDSSKSNTKLAILLLPQYAFTRLYIQVRGKFQLKKRHLEILGYQVVFLNVSEWSNLYYDDERTEFLSKLLFHDKSRMDIIR